MTRATPLEAKRILAEEGARVGAKFLADDIKEGARPETGSLEWWHKNANPSERAETRYNLAHLRAYVRIAGQDRWPAAGIPLARFRLWLDGVTG